MEEPHRLAWRNADATAAIAVTFDPQDDKTVWTMVMVARFPLPAARLVDYLKTRGETTV